MSKLHTSGVDRATRETDTEYPRGNHPITEIGDPIDVDAWIASTVTDAIEP